jgi:hypothetical protein
VVLEEVPVRFRSTLIYLVAAMVLVAFYLYETRKETREKAAKEEAKVLFPVKPDQLVGITLKRGEESIRIEKTNSAGAWEIVSPLHASADPFALSTLTKKLSELKYERLISENAKDLAEFGLDKPSLVVSYKAGKDEGTISFGSRSPMGYGVYAATGDGRKVYLMADADKQEVDRSVFDLRNKKLLALETGRVNRIVVERGTIRWVLNKKDDRWSLEGDENLKVDREKVDDFVRPLVWAEALSFEKEDAVDLKPYGLDHPSARVVLSDGSKTEEMIFGDVAKGGRGERIYAMVRGKPQVVTVPKSLMDDLPAEKDQLREPERSKKEGAT